MGFGLDIKQKPIEVSKENWVEYKGIFYPPNKARALKAWDTMRAKQEKQSYDRNKKNQVRTKIIEIIKSNCKENSNILTMETKEFLLSKALSNFNFVVCEKDINEYIKMEKNKPANVKFLYHGNIGDIDFFDGIYDIIYLDFCCTFETAKSIIEKLFFKIRGTSCFGFTFCLRKNQKKLNDYKFDMIKKIQDFLSVQPMPDYNGYKIKLAYELVYGESYRDKEHAPMITIFYKNNTTEQIDKFLRTLDFDTIKNECKKRGIL